MLKENDYWQTPQYILDKVNEFWPEGWFDPCPANHEIDRLHRIWPEKCYINPPFSQYLKWAQHGRLQPLGQIWMMDHDHSTKRMQLLMPGAVLCLLHDRVIFIDPKTGKPAVNKKTGKKQTPPKPQTLLYRGNEPARFKQVFQSIGHVVWEAV